MYLNPKEYQLKDMPVQCKDLVRINAVKSKCLNYFVGNTATILSNQGGSVRKLT